MAVSGISDFAIGGLVSGMDTNTIVEKMMKSYEKQGATLYTKESDITRKKTILQELNLSLMRLKNSAFDLRLDTLYKNKNITSSNENVVSATAGPAAVNGQHTVKVDQLARQARAISSVYSPRVSNNPANTAGITGIAGALSPTPVYLKGAVAESATDSDMIATSINSTNNQLQLTYDGTTVTVSLADATANTTTLQSVADDVESKANNALNTAFGTNNVNYLVVQPSSEAGSGNDFLYIMSNFNGSQHSVSVSSTCSAAAALGYNSGVTTVAGTDATGGTHNLTFSDAASYALTSGAYSANVTVNATDVMNLTINGTTSNVALTTTAAGGTAGVYDYTNDTQMAELATNLQTDINTAFGSSAVTVAWDSTNKKLTVTDALAGASNTITVNADTTGTPSTTLLLTSGTGASSTAGVDAKVIDVFTPDNGVQSTSTVTDTTSAGTASTMAGLLTAINGGTRDAGHTTTGGGPLMSGVTLTASSGLTAGTAQINTTRGNELNTQLATYATYTGASNIGTTTIATSQTLQNAGFTTAASTSTNGTFTINGKTITISNYATTRVNDVLAMINGSGAGVTASYDNTNDRFVLTANTIGGDQTITVGSGTDTSNFLTIAGLSDSLGGTYTAGQDDGSVDTTVALNSSGLSKSVTTGTFSINGVSIYVNPTTDTLDDIISRINTSSAGVTASYNSTNDTLQLVSNGDETNSDVIKIGSASDTSNFWWATNMVYPPNEDLDSDDILENEVMIGSPGQHAKLEVDGVSYTRASNDIDDIIAGVTLKLNSTSSSTATLNITSNTDQAFEKMKAFIVNYNKIMDMTYQEALTKDERKKEIPELTEDQENSMSDDDIDDYNTNRESLLRQDILHRDTDVKGIHNTLRRLASQSVEGLDGQYNSLNSLGINTGAIGSEYDSNLQGYLLTNSTDEAEIETALKNNTTFMTALEENPDKVMQILGNLTQSTVSVTGKSLTSSVTLTGALKFSVGDGTTRAEINIASGTYTPAKIVNQINDSISKAGISSIKATINSAQQIVLKAATEEDATSGQAVLDITDLSGGSLYSALGIQPGLSRGTQISSSTGIARQIETLLNNYTKSGGILNTRIKTGGTLDSELSSIEKKIDAFEERMTLIEKRLWDRFSSLETYMGDKNTQSQWLTSQISALTGNSSSS
ncbi:MAG: flagellar filament capping protein FliD [Chitinophagales bacterium]